MKWNEKKVGYAVMHQIMERSAVVVPNCNYTGYEADLLVVTKDLRLIDVEIKVDRSDLKADLKKDKWWRGEYIHEGGDTIGPFPPKIWKHYYVMPAKVWDDSLYPAIPPTSGVVLINEYPHTKSKLRMDVIRRATPNRKAPKISPQEAFQVGRLCNLRMWDRIMSVETQKQPIGTLKVSSEYLRRVRSGESPDPALLDMLAGCLVMDVKHDFMDDSTTYMLWCKDFEPVERSEVLPSYQIVVEAGKPCWRRDTSVVLSYNQGATGA